MKGFVLSLIIINIGLFGLAYFSTKIGRQAERQAIQKPNTVERKAIRLEIEKEHLAEIQRRQKEHEKNILKE